MNGDQEFARLVDQHYGPLYRFAFSLTRSEAAACDLVQETFYIWVRKRGQLREGGRVKSWLFTTLHREFLQIRRHETRFPQVNLAEVGPEELTDPGRAVQQVDGRQLVELLHQLDPVFCAPLALFYLEDYSYEEIGEALELPLGTVKSRLSRGIAQLKARLAADLKRENGGSNGQA